MPTHAQFLPATLALTATLGWGMSDFLGGYAARRANAFLLTTITHLSGTLFVLMLALSMHSVFIEKRYVGWAMAAGVCGGLSLAIFYRALAIGNMGLIAPVGAVLGAVIPAIVDLFRDGIPGGMRITGFVLAAIGIWFISRAEGSSGNPRGLGLAVLAGIGFAGYFLCIRQAGDGSVLWIAVLSRATSFLATGVLVLLARQFKPMDATGVGWGVLAGVLDITGSVFFVSASHAGRLDVAVMISSLYSAFTVLLARLFLKEHFSRGRVVGLAAALLAVPMIAW